MRIETFTVSGNTHRYENNEVVFWLKDGIVTDGWFHGNSIPSFLKGQPYQYSEKILRNAEKNGMRFCSKCGRELPKDSGISFLAGYLCKDCGREVYETEAKYDRIYRRT